MTFWDLVAGNIYAHRRGNFAVLLGVAVGTAVLTGALLVGDSLRGSLRASAERQIAKVTHVLLAPRFFRQELSDSIDGLRNYTGAIVLRTSARTADGRVARKVTLYGVAEKFWTEVFSSKAVPESDQLPPNWSLDRGGTFTTLEEHGVLIGQSLADELGIRVGDRLTFSIQKPSGLPRESVLGRRKTEDVLVPVTLEVKRVLAKNHFASRFSLQPGNTIPRNAYVRLDLLQEYIRYHARNRKFLPRRPINAIMVADEAASADALQEGTNVELIDLGLKLRKPRRKLGRPAPNYLSLESGEMYIPPAAEKAVRDAGLRHSPTLVYLVNKIEPATLLDAFGVTFVLGHGWWHPFAGAAAAPVQGRFVPYAIVAAVEPDLAPPLGPFVPPSMGKLSDDELLLVRWPGSPLNRLRPGERIRLVYYDPQAEGQLRELSEVFRLKGIAEISGPRDDMHLTPEFPGITDSRTMVQQIGSSNGWDPPFPFHREWVDQDDEDFWRDYRTTPKAYITLAAGRKLWSTRYGEATSIRIDPQGKGIEEIESAILAKIDPRDFGLQWRSLRQAVADASTGSNDFGMLFLGFSFFLIASALLLIILLFRLNLDRRADELGLLFAVGFRRGKVWRLLLAEGSLLSVFGALAGVVLALGFGAAMIRFLAVSWPGELDRESLQLWPTFQSLLIGFFASVIVSILTIAWATRVLAKATPTSLLAGRTSEDGGIQPRKRHRVAWSLLVLGVLGGAACYVFGLYAQEHEAKAGSFMGSGFLLLAAGLAAAWLRLQPRPVRPVVQGGLAGLARLGIRNADRHPLRSLLTLGLLAAATFLVFSVEAFHRRPDEHFLERTGGSGGFPLVAETDVPVFENLNADRFKSELAAAAGHQQSEQVRFYPLRLRAGDDISCLNLYKPSEPRILGVPNTIIDRGGFRFAATLATTEKEQANPWLLLRKSLEDGAVPVFAEANTVTWVLKSHLGGIVTVKDDAGRPVRLRIVGMLRDSVFQGELLMADSRFVRLFPREEGFRVFLIEAPADHSEAIAGAIERTFADYGMDVESTRQRLALFLAVENTYLATFQALGGLGLLLGALGLAVVMLRSVWERRGELALMRAVGFRRSALGWMVLVENAFLLLLGLILGSAAAAFSVAPHLAEGARLPWREMAGLLILVFVVGLAAGGLALAATLRAPLLPALRRE